MKETDGTLCVVHGDLDDSFPLGIDSEKFSSVTKLLRVTAW